MDGRLNSGLFSSIHRHMRFLKGWELIHVVDKQIDTFHKYQLMFLSVDFWESLRKDKVLVFQRDSEILKYGVEDFLRLDYSFIGAPWLPDVPWNTHDRRGGNGGISIRDVNQHIAVLRDNPIENILSDHRESLLKRGLSEPTGKGLSEDVWFSHKLSSVAPYEVCSEFSVETEFRLGTVCAHAIDRHLTGEQCSKIRKQYLKML